MREYGNKITLVRNARDCYVLDPIMGCAAGVENNPGGCYGECYALRHSRRGGYNFSKNQLRHFEDEQHKRKIVGRINKIEMPFVRLGSTGDPSADWAHTIGILEAIACCDKEIVIITKHWNTLTGEQLKRLGAVGVCVNTSVSALDDLHSLEIKLGQYERLKPYCKSVLRIVSCDFNLQNPQGSTLAHLQACLFANDRVLDTVFRPSKNNPLVLGGVINTFCGVFLGKKRRMSKYSRDTYLGICSKCPEMCGVNL